MNQTRDLCHSCLPIAGPEAASKDRSLLSNYEMQELREFEDAYFLEHVAKKVRPSGSASNYGYDDADHHYPAIIADYIGYHFEIRVTIGKANPSAAATTRRGRTSRSR